MASEKEASCQNLCANDPNFAIICSFLDRFSSSCGVVYPTFSDLQDMVENSDEVPRELIDLHVKLLRKIRKSVTTEKWERALVKFCHSYYCSEDGWELERCGYKKCKISVKLRILKTLLDAQFDLNAKFKNDVNKLTAEELRIEPMGKDKVGQSYWCQFDSSANVRVYKEDQDEETWKLVAKDRNGLVDLISQLSSGDELLGLEVINEDSNSQEVEKPIIDTGQVEISTSEENTADNTSSIDMKLENDIKEDTNSHEDSLNPNESSLAVINENLVSNSEVSTMTSVNKYLVVAKEIIPPTEDSKSPTQSYQDFDSSNHSTNEKNLDKIEQHSPSQSINANPNSNIEEGNDFNNSSCSSKNGENHKSESKSSDKIISKDSETCNVDVTEEIKQRSLFKSSNVSIFKGKGSKLDQIFSRKFDQRGIRPDHELKSATDLTVAQLSEKEEHDSPSILQKNDDTVSTIQENECDNFCPTEDNKKRKTDEVTDQDSKKKCIEVDSNIEVGEAIEDPVLIIKGEGSGKECDTGNPGRQNETSDSSDETKSNMSDTNDLVVPCKESQSTSDFENHSKKTVQEDIEIKETNINNGIMNTIGNILNYEDKKDSNNKINQLEKFNFGNQCSELNEMKEKKSIMDKTLVINTNHNTQQISNTSCEFEKSIEEQLCDITGEQFVPSPKDTSNNTENLEKPCERILAAKQGEKGVRRKSFDNTNLIENDSHPEAKKTKILEENLEIFGCLSDNEMDANIIDSKISQNVSPKVSEKSLINELNITTTSSNIVDNKESMDNSSSILNERLLSFNSNLIENKNHDSKEKDSEAIDVNITQEDNKLVETQHDPNTLLKSYNSDDALLKECKLTTENQNFSETNVNSDVIEDSNKCLELTSELHKKDKHIIVSKKNTKPTKDFDIDNVKKENACNKNKKNNRNIKHVMSNTNNLESDEKNTILDSEKINCAEKGETLQGSKLLGIESSKSNDTTDEVKKIENEESLLEGHNTLTFSEEDCKNETKKRLSPKKSPKTRRKVFSTKSKKRISKKVDNDPIKNESLKNLNSENEKAEDVESSPTKAILCEKDFGKKSEDSNKDCKPQTVKSNKDIKKNDPKPELIKNRKRRCSRRNTGTEKESEDDVTSDKKEKNDDNEEEIGGKRRKMKAKRTANRTARKLVEDKRNTKSSSEDDNQMNENKELKKSPVKPSPSKASKAKTTVKSTAKTKSQLKNKKENSESTKISQEPPVHTNKKKKVAKSQGRNSRAFLGIDLNIDINESSRSVRQSSRLAQIKIKEQVDHKIDDSHQKVEKSGKKTKKKKDQTEENQKGASKKRNKAKVIIEDEEDLADPEPSERKKSRKKKKKNPLKFNEHNPWKSSSGSSSEVEEEEEDHFDEIVEEEEDLALNIKSDHEFSPESDLENDVEWKPIRRARTAKKDPEVEDREAIKDTDDFACEKCGKKDHPEWILLCDSCDHGWHASCLRPSLMLIPEGDWHCPPCQHAVLVKRLQETLKIYDRDTKRRENEELRKKRLAYVGISLDNVLPLSNNQTREKRNESDSESESSESPRSSSESESEDSDEPVYQLRQRRQGTTSYRFNEFDDLINSAIQDEVEVRNTVSLPSNTPAVDSTVINEGGHKVTQENLSKVESAPKEDNENATSAIAEKADTKNIKKSKNESGDDSSEEDDDEDEEEEEFPSVVPKRNNVLRRPGKKKHRRLNCLDDPSDDDDGSDEDFKGSSSDEEEEEDEEEDTDDSDIRGKGRSKRGHLGPVRRSSRARTSRFDKEFINDNSDESDAPRRKKTKKLWSESESESDDSTWGRRKKKKGVTSKTRRKKSKKFAIEDELSEAESSKTPKKKRQRKIKYGGLDDLNVEELPARRTRGMKINYQEVIGTDSDEDVQKTKSSKRAVIDDEDEFVAEKEEEEMSATSSDDGKNVNEDESEAVISSEDEVKEFVESPTKFDQREEKEEKSQSYTKISPPKPLNNEKTMSNRRGRPPKAMIAPPPERLISEDEQYKAVVSKVSTLPHPENSNYKRSEIELINTVDIQEMSNKVSGPKEFIEPVQPITPIKIPNSSFDPKLIKRSPPIKIRSGVPVNTVGRKSPGMINSSKEVSLFPISPPPNPGIIHSPPEKSLNPMQIPITVTQLEKHNLSFSSVRKPTNLPSSLVKSEMLPVEEDGDLDDDDLINDIEEEEEDDDEDDSDDDILEEGEIPKKVARRMARMEEKLQQKLEERRLSRQQTKDVKLSQPVAVENKPISSGLTSPDAKNEQKPTPTTQPTQPLLRVVSPLKLMANPPGPLQSTFMHTGINSRMPVSSPPSRMPMPLTTPLPPNAIPPVMGMDDGSFAKRRGRGRAKKPGAPEKPDQNMVAGSSVIRGMLQQPQAYPPNQYSQQYPSHPRVPFNPQRMPRPPFHPSHHNLDPSSSGAGPVAGAINIKQEPVSQPPTSNPVHIPNKPPYPHNPQHRFDSLPRQPNYPPQGTPQGKQQYGSYPPHSAPNSNYHYGSFPPPMASREEQHVYPVQQPFSEQFIDQTGIPAATSSNKSATEEESGEFGGLVSYFSSQREYDIDT